MPPKSTNNGCLANPWAYTEGDYDSDMDGHQCAAVADGVAFESICHGCGHPWRYTVSYEEIAALRVGISPHCVPGIPDASAWERSLPAEDAPPDLAAGGLTWVSRPSCKPTPDSLTSPMSSPTCRQILVSCTQLDAEKWLAEAQQRGWITGADARQYAEAAVNAVAADLPATVPVSDTKMPQWMADLSASDRLSFQLRQTLNSAIRIGLIGPVQLARSFAASVGPAHTAVIAESPVTKEFDEIGGEAYVARFWEELGRICKDDAARSRSDGD